MEVWVYAGLGGLQARIRSLAADIWGTRRGMCCGGCVGTFPANTSGRGASCIGVYYLHSVATGAYGARM